ncbi:MAG: hypothetical protein LBV69_08295 [Bacteroidales bacterium]|nr:hypothetical protein [Bacteroidales bacterium]
MKKRTLKDQMEESVLSKHSLKDIYGGACGVTSTWHISNENTDQNHDGKADDCEDDPDADYEPDLDSLPLARLRP